MQTTGVNDSQPNIEEVKAYCKELNSNVDPVKFFEYYERNNWICGGTPVEDWRALFRSWNKNELNKRPVKEKYWWHPKMAGLDDPQFVADLEAFMRE